MSELILPVFYVVLQLLVIIGIGIVVRRTGGWADDFFRGLSRLVIRVALPCYFIVRLGLTDFSLIRTVMIMPVSALVVIGLGLLLSLVVFRVLPFQGGDRRAGIALAAFGNSGYLPLALAELVPVTIPVVAERYGTEMPPVLVAGYVLAQSPLLWSVGRAIVTREDGTDGGFRLRHLISAPVVGILTGILISASGLGALLSDPRLPLAPVFLALERLAAVALPLALLNLGGLIGGLRVERSDWKLLVGVGGTVLLVRFLVIPALFFTAVFMGLGRVVAPAVLFVLFLETHTPPATNLSLMSNEAGVNQHHTAVTLLSSYLVYLVLMPFYLIAFLAVTR